MAGTFILESFYIRKNLRKKRKKHFLFLRSAYFMMYVLQYRSLFSSKKEKQRAGVLIIGAPAYVIHACLSLLIAVFLTFGDSAVYNMDSK